MVRSTVSRSLEECRKRGWSAAVTEHWITIPTHPAGGIRRDLWGVGDIIATTPGVSGSMLIQSTSGRGDVAKHLRKVAALVSSWEPPTKFPYLPCPILAWMVAGNQLAVWSWAKRGAAGKRKLWTVKEHPILLDELEALREEQGRDVF